jgi:deoxyribodipyrimidine photo-lyase
LWDDSPGLGAWRARLTGIPIVDAGKRQLRTEGWMQNRTRLVTASFRIRDLAIDSRVRSEQFMYSIRRRGCRHQLRDRAVGGRHRNDSRPNRRFNLLRLALRYDHDGQYVPELAEIQGPAVHEPWTLGRQSLERLGYPSPII